MKVDCNWLSGSLHRRKWPPDQAAGHGPVGAGELIKDSTVLHQLLKALNLVGNIRMKFILMGQMKALTLQHFRDSPQWDFTVHLFKCLENTESIPHRNSVIADRFYQGIYGEDICFPWTESASDQLAGMQVWGGVTHSPPQASSCWI
jgi:hypothetical protein